MRRALGAAAVAACLLGVGGCSDGEADAAPSPSSSSSTPSETPTASPSPTAVAPTLPPEAMERTAAGAEAFVRHWFEVLEYAYATGSTEPLDEISGQECESCQTFIERINDRYSSGGSFRGLLITISSSAAPPPDEFGSEVSLQLEEGAFDEIDSSGRLVGHHPAAPSASALFFAQWLGNSWMAFELAQGGS